MEGSPVSPVGYADGDARLGRTLSVDWSAASDLARRATGPGRLVAASDHWVFWREVDWQWGVTLAGRALANAGIGAADRVAVRPLNPHQDAAMLEGAVAIGAQAALDDGGLPENWATALVAEPFALLGRPPSQSVRRVLLRAGPATSPAVVGRLAELAPQDILFVQAWGPPEFPGPLALQCSEGQLHVTEDELTAEWMTDADGAHLCVSREGMPGMADAVLDDLVLPGTCPCGLGGLAFAAVLDRGAAVRVEGRRLARHDLIDACFRTPGFSGSARIEVRYDRGRGRNYLLVRTAPRTEGEGRETADALAYSLALATGLPVRVEWRHEEGPAGVSLQDARG